MQHIRNLLLRFGLLGALLAVAIVGGTTAFFSDHETSVDNVLAAGAIDLKIDNTSWLNGVAQAATSWGLDDLPGHLFFDFHDLKPGDLGEDTVSIHVLDNDAWVCGNITLTESADNGINEPEAGAGDATDGQWNGELDERLQFVFWADDGDNVLEDNENVLLTGSPSQLPQDPGTPGMDFTLADSTQNVFTDLLDDPLLGTQTYYIGKAFCFGTLTEQPVAAGFGIDPSVDPGVRCDGSLETNISQTDSVKGDVSFTAVQSRDLPDFICGQPIPSPSSTPTPSATPSPSPSASPLACTEVWANAVTSSTQTLRKNGTAVLPDRTDPLDALVAESSGAAFDSPVLAGTFFSLGFGGTITVEYTNLINNIAGDDVTLFEVTGGPPYPDEIAKVEASVDNITYITLNPGLTKDGGVDLGILPAAKYIRVTDVSTPALFEDTADGYDLDGVKALCGT